MDVQTQDIIFKLMFVIWAVICISWIIYRNKLQKKIQKDHHEKWVALGRPAVSDMFAGFTAPPWEHFDILQRMFRSEYRMMRYIFYGDTELDHDQEVRRLRMNTKYAFFGILAYFFFVMVVGGIITSSYATQDDAFTTKPNHSITVRLFATCSQNKEIYATYYSDNKVDVELYRDNKFVSSTIMIATSGVAISEDGFSKFWEDSDEITHFEQKDDKLLCDKPTVIE